MPQIQNFSQACAALQQFYDPHQVAFTLERMQQLMEFLGNPQNSLKVVHVAGTSGKTSTAYYAAALLEQSGASVGLTVSPHVDEVNERVQLNRTPLPEKLFCKELSEFLGLISGSDVQPSYFEVMVAFAYWEFVKQGVDYAVVEVGLGGRLDATNIIDRTDKVCIITDIGLDHTEILGDTLAKIATEKAQIILPGNQVFMHQQASEVMDVVKERCIPQNAPLYVVHAAKMEGLDLPLFQQRNLSLALEAVKYTLARDGRPALTEQQIAEAAKIYIPARMERRRMGNKNIIIDGAHNAQKLGALVKSLREAYPDQAVAALVAFVQGIDTRWQGGIDEIMGLAEEIIITEFTATQDTPKSSVSGGVIADYCRAGGYANVEVEKNPAKALAKLQAKSQPILLVAGSFYLLNSVRPLLAEI